MNPRTVFSLFLVLALFLSLFLTVIVVACGDDDDDDDNDDSDGDDEDATDDDSGDDDDTGIDDDDNDDNDDDDDDDDEDDDDDDTTTEGFVFISSGVFTMGSPEGPSPPEEPGHENDETQHQVTLTNDFEIMATEVTQSQFETLLGWNPSSISGCGGDCPVDTVSWFDAVAYSIELSNVFYWNPCYSLSDVVCNDATNVGANYMNCMNPTQGGIDSATLALNGVTSVYDCQGFRLPTEAEWEYAARANTTAAYYNGQNSDPDHLACETPFHLTEIAWYCGVGKSGTMNPAGQLTPNDWGLYDMSGNVYEWVWDWYHDYPGDETDPEGPASGSYRVYRGGSWDDQARYCRSANRDEGDPDSRYQDLGFRLARTRQ